MGKGHKKSRSMSESESSGNKNPRSIGIKAPLYQKKTLGDERTEGHLEGLRS